MMARGWIDSVSVPFNVIYLGTSFRTLGKSFNFRQSRSLGFWMFPYHETFLIMLAASYIWLQGVQESGLLEVGRRHIRDSKGTCLRFTISYIPDPYFTMHR
jgi:hypothetical protein